MQKTQAISKTYAPVSTLVLALCLALGGCSSDDEGSQNDGQGSTEDGGTGEGTDAGEGTGFGNSAGISGGGIVDFDAGSIVNTAGNGATCAEGDANAHPITPTVWLIVDGSSSMKTAFDAVANRWVTLRDTLMSDTGVVQSLQANVNFGMVIYSGGNTDPLQCENLVIVDPKTNNFDTLDAQYPATPIGTGTPTDKALDYVVTTLPVDNEQMLDVDVDPVYVVLATDGAPNACDGSSTGSGPSGFDPIVAQRVVDVVTKGTKAGMKMFVISLAGADAVLQTHLEEVASKTNSGEAPFVPSTKDELVTTFEKIISGATCKVTLQGTVKAGEECKGSVELSGKKLACNSANGWKLLDEHTVQLTGTACKSFLSKDSSVKATFPCDVFVPE